MVTNSNDTDSPKFTDNYPMLHNNSLSSIVNHPIPVSNSNIKCWGKECACRKHQCIDIIVPLVSTGIQSSITVLAVPLVKNVSGSPSTSAMRFC